MSRWFRFYDDAVNDPKVQRLPGEKFKVWVNLLCLASKNDGVLPPLVDIAFILRMTEEKISSLLNEFCAAMLIDPTEVENAPMSYAPHNWDGRQYRSDVTDPTAPTRQKRYRDRKRNDRNATVTDKRPESEQIQTTETEKQNAAAPQAALDGFDSLTGRKLNPNPEADYFWRIKEIVGQAHGGALAKRLLAAKGGNIALARAAAEQASTKQDPREYLGAIIRNKDSPASDQSGRSF